MKAGTCAATVPSMPSMHTSPDGALAGAAIVMAAVFAIFATMQFADDRQSDGR